MQVRLVDLASTRYAIARRYMIRLRRDDFEERDRLSAKMCLGHPIFGNNTNSCARTDLFLSHGRNPGICRITCKPSCA